MVFHTHTHTHTERERERETARDTDRHYIKSFYISSISAHIMS